MDFFNVFTPIFGLLWIVYHFYTAKSMLKSEIYTNNKMDIVLLQRMLYNGNNLILGEKSVAL